MTSLFSNFHQADILLCKALEDMHKHEPADAQHEQTERIFEDYRQHVRSISEELLSSLKDE